MTPNPVVLATFTMKDFTPWSTDRSIELNRFDALVVVIVTTLLAIIAAPSRSNSFYPPDVDTWSGRSIGNVYSIPQTPVRSGQQVEIRSANPGFSLANQDLKLPEKLVAKAPFIARWSYYLSDHQSDLQTIRDVSIL